MSFLRPLLGLALLAGLLSLTDPQALLATFKQTDLKLFGAALVLAIVANLICVYRWQLIARIHLPNRCRWCSTSNRCNQPM